GADGPAATNPISLATSVTVLNSLGANNGPLNVVWVDADGNGTPEPVSYSWNAATQTLTGTSAHFPAGDPVFTLHINTNGSYTFNLNAPLAHPFTDNDFKNNGPDTEFEDNLNLQFTYTATDGDGDFVTGTISIKVDDDTPDPVGEQFEVTEGGQGNVNVVLILDHSGSMAGTDVSGFASRLDLAKFAAINLLNSANINQVMTVQFDSGSAINTESGNFWTSKADAISYINGLTP